MTFWIIAAVVIAVIVGLGKVDSMLEKSRKGAAGDFGFEILEKLAALAVVGLIWWLVA